MGDAKTNRRKNTKQLKSTVMIACVDSHHRTQNNQSALSRTMGLEYAVDYRND